MANYHVISAFISGVKVMPRHCDYRQRAVPVDVENAIYQPGAPPRSDAPRRRYAKPFPHCKRSIPNSREDALQIGVWLREKHGTVGEFQPAIRLPVFSSKLPRFGDGARRTVLIPESNCLTRASQRNGDKCPGDA